MNKQISRTVALALVASLVLLSVAGCDSVTSETPKVDPPAPSTPTITVDGSAADWTALEQAKVTTAETSNTGDVSPLATFSSMKAYTDGKKLFLMFSGSGLVATSFSSGDSNSEILIDADGDPATGFGPGHWWNGGTENSAFGAEYTVHAGYVHFNVSPLADNWGPVAVDTGLATSEVMISGDGTVMELGIPLVGGLVGPKTIRIGAYIANGATFTYVPNNWGDLLSVTIPAAN